MKMLFFMIRKYLSKSQKRALNQSITTMGKKCVWRIILSTYSNQLMFGHSEKYTKFEKNLPLKIWRYSVVSNFKWKIFSNFVAFSEDPNFKLTSLKKKIQKKNPLSIWRYSVVSNFKWKIFSNFVAFSEYPNQQFWKIHQNAWVIIRLS